MRIPRYLLCGEIADWFDEPFANSSQFPTYLCRG